ncbi:hypothetical protein FRC07_014632, partial [Ceratobasidium sp. 392]
MGHDNGHPHASIVPHQPTLPLVGLELNPSNFGRQTSEFSVGHSDTGANVPGFDAGQELLMGDWVQDGERWNPYSSNLYTPDPFAPGVVGVIETSEVQSTFD